MVKLTPAQRAFLQPYRDREKVLGGGPVILPNEVSVGGHASASATKRKVRNRAMDVRSCKFVLRHKPTGVEVEGGIPEGHYSKKEMQRLKQQAQDNLMGALDSKVRFWASRMLKEEWADG